MKRTNIASIALAGATILVSSQVVFAETGRYTMTPTKDGVLKLDTRTGAVSLCRRAATGWTCQGVEDNSRGMNKRLRRLERENAELRAQLDARRLSPAPESDGKIELPSEEDVDKAMDFMEKLLNRFKGMVEDLKKDKKEDNGVPL